MSNYADFLRQAREEYARETAEEATEQERERGGFRRASEEPPLTTVRASDPRRQAIINLVEHGATEGEREAARAALARIDQEQQDEDDYLDALHHGAA